MDYHSNACFKYAKHDSIYNKSSQVGLFLQVGGRGSIAGALRSFLFADKLIAVHPSATYPCNLTSYHVTHSVYTYVHTR
jgi:hypothetical protein